MSKVRTFFGDRERDFDLTLTMVLELERVTGAGIGSLFMRIINNNFEAAEITETIRLAMIGGGEDPEIAVCLITAYASVLPLFQLHALAVDILAMLWFGRTDPEAPANG